MLYELHLGDELCPGPVLSQNSLLLCLFLLLACEPLADTVSASAHLWVEHRTGTQKICACGPPSNAQGHATLPHPGVPRLRVLGAQKENKGPLNINLLSPWVGQGLGNRNRVGRVPDFEEARTSELLTSELK